MTAYLEAAQEEGDTALITAALGDIARVEGLTAAEKEELDRRRENYRRNPQSVSPWAEVKERILNRP